MFMTPKVKKKKKLSLKQKLSLLSQNTFHHTLLTSHPLEGIKHIKKLNLGWPQKLTHNHMYRV